MEKVIFDIVRPYLIDRPDILILVVFVVFSIIYIRWYVKMFEGWLHRHDDQLRESNKMNVEILAKVSNIEGRLDECTKTRSRKGQ